MDLSPAFRPPRGPGAAIRVRRVVAAICFLALTAADSSAFKPDIHAETTRDALGVRLGRELPDKVKAELKTLGLTGTGFTSPGFTDQALEEVMNANKAMDTGDCGGLGDDKPATACEVLTEGLAALVQLLTKGATEAAHFDAEKIQEGSNLVFGHRATIRRYLLAGNFEGARRFLGYALHSIQDFYAHSNWVELGRTGIDGRLGTRQNAFSAGSPRLALGNEPMCVDVGVEESWLDSLGGDIAAAGNWIGTHIEGSVPFQDSGPVADRTRLLTQLTGAQQQRLVKIYADAEAQAKAKGEPFNSPITALTLEKVLLDRPLTSGHFYMFYPEVNYTLDRLPTVDEFINLLDLPGRGDPPVITKFGKCRHGWSLSYTHWSQATLTYKQAGINKDEPSRVGFSTARDRAFDHSFDFVMSVIKDSMIAGRADYPKLILGLMGYEPAGPLINSFTIYKVPAAPPRQNLWDEVTAVLFNIFAVHPDIQACVAFGGRGGCAPECSNADTWNPERRCTQRLVFNLPTSGTIRVEVWDNDPGGLRQLMAAGDVDVTDPCLKLSDHPPCEIRSANSDDDPLLISFESPDRSVIPSSLPPHPDGTPPPPAPGGAGGGGGGGAGAGGGGAAPSPAERLAPTPGAPSSPALPASAPGARALTPSAMAALRTPEGIDAALRLRDADNCVGGDAFFPAGTPLDTSAIGRRLGPDQTNRLYQAAALAMVVADPTAKGNVMAAINAKVRGDDFLDVMTSVMTNPVQAPAIASGYTGVAKYLAGQVVATGLDKLLTRPAADLSPEVGRWILKRLATAPLASEAVDRILTSPTPVSAECTINELAKAGFTDVVNGL